MLGNYSEAEQLEAFQERFSAEKLVLLLVSHLKKGEGPSTDNKMYLSETQCLAKFWCNA